MHIIDTVIASLLYLRLIYRYVTRQFLLYDLTLHPCILGANETQSETSLYFLSQQMLSYLNQLWL